jgi:hypothetical protein
MRKAFVDTAMKIRVHKMLEISWVTEQLLVSQEGLSCI